jgi:hypothetical protein
MDIQLLLGHEGILAQGALKSLVVSVRPHMGHQIRLVRTRMLAK